MTKSVKLEIFEIISAFGIHLYIQTIGTLLPRFIKIFGNIEQLASCQKFRNPEQVQVIK